MPKYEVTLARYATVTYSTTVEVEAENEDEAMQTAHDIYEDKLGDLDWDEGADADFDGWDIVDVEEVED